MNKQKTWRAVEEHIKQMGIKYPHLKFKLVDSGQGHIKILMNGSYLNKLSVMKGREGCSKNCKKSLSGFLRQMTYQIDRYVEKNPVKEIPEDEFGDD